MCAIAMLDPSRRKEVAKTVFPSFQFCHAHDIICLSLLAKQKRALRVKF